MTTSCTCERRLCEWCNPPKLVRCYPLRPLLTDEQWVAVAPFIRETFSETYETMMAAHFGFWPAFRALRDASGLPRTELYATYEVARDIESALYARAVALGHAPVMAPGRKR